MWFGVVKVRMVIGFDVGKVAASMGFYCYGSAYSGTRSLTFIIPPLRQNVHRRYLYVFT